MTEILKRIQQETREWHERIEALVPIFDPSFGLQDYQRLLELFYGFYSEYEKALGAVPDLDRFLPDWGDRLKTPWLEQDLKWLGYTQSDLAPLTMCSEIPALDTMARVFGALYVTEGSTLGGQLIARHLQASLNLHADEGARFFAGPGRETGSRWKVFTEALRGMATPSNEDEIVQSAVDTFQKLGRWLSQPYTIQRDGLDAGQDGTEFKSPSAQLRKPHLAQRN